MNKPENRLEFLIRDLPSPESARRFFQQFAERNPAHLTRLQKNEGLFSDILALASYSPLLAATLIQNPEYIGWLAGKRSGSAVYEKDDLLESLARFALTHSQLEPNVLLARFRRRELLRIFLRDIRRLGTIAEITEEISNLADAILEYAGRLARQEMDNRYGPPFEVDEKGRQRPSDVCIVSLGKLGSKELNYSSDIDLLFIYSAEGSTTGTGSREPVTNREYFVKFAETVTHIVGRQTGEGAAYRVDLRLRPHGRVGALALSLKETVRYYLNEALNWEQQVLIRSRASAGNSSLYKDFFSRVEESVFRKGRDVKEALREVYLSKEKIDKQRRSETAFDVKLGPGGIREIEFIAQALQLAHGGDDRWLRVPHTLISISRLADRGYLSDEERSGLSNAYDFLRRLEHILQMEHGLQTHTLPTDVEKREIISAKMRCRTRREFETSVARHTNNVHASFLRVFGRDAVSAIVSDGSADSKQIGTPPPEPENEVEPASVHFERQIIASLEKQATHIPLDEERLEVIHRVSEVSPPFAQLISSRPWLIENLKKPVVTAAVPDYDAEFAAAVDIDGDRASVLNQMRAVWSRLLLEIATADIYEALPLREIRARQTMLAEASIRIAVRGAAHELSQKHAGFPAILDILALGKLGSGTLDYESDLDVIIVYRESESGPEEIALSELYSRAAAVFVTLLSGMTRDGNLYRVDLRLRPHGKNGPNVTTAGALVEYIENSASIWELLAYVQMRAVRTGSESREEVETTVREAIKRRAARETPAEIGREARDMRLRLEESHAPGPGGRNIDIKFGSGGLLDVYFVVRYLYLTNFDAVMPDISSTSARLDAFRAVGILSSGDHATLREGHSFLSTLDHNIRLAIGRSSRLPRGNQALLERIAARMGAGSAEVLVQQLTLHRMNIRAAFDNVFCE
jgi:glutamate-ammonia-ligase adenylyltransferase